jgi:hypothetical protein
MGERRWWISWQEPTGDDGDYRPVSWPLPKSVLGWWCTGEAMDSSYATLVAWVAAANEKAAKSLIEKHWKPGPWRFCDERQLDWTPGDRFPMKEAPNAAG